MSFPKITDSVWILCSVFSKWKWELVVRLLICFRHITCLVCALKMALSYQRRPIWRYLFRGSSAVGLGGLCVWLTALSAFSCNGNAVTIGSFSIPGKSPISICWTAVSYRNSTYIRPDACQRWCRQVSSEDVGFFPPFLSKVDKNKSCI